MISVQDGQNRILTRITRSTSPEFLPLGKTLGRVVAEDVLARFSEPPTDNSPVDAYTVWITDLPASGTPHFSGAPGCPAAPPSAPRQLTSWTSASSPTSGTRSARASPTRGRPATSS